jgi:hypothetical protein
VVIIFFKEAR